MVGPKSRDGIGSLARGGRPCRGLLLPARLFCGQADLGGPELGRAPPELQQREGVAPRHICRVGDRDGAGSGGAGCLRRLRPRSPQRDARGLPRRRRRSRCIGPPPRRRWQPLCRTTRRLRACSARPLRARRQPTKGKCAARSYLRQARLQRSCPDRRQTGSGPPTFRLRRNFGQFSTLVRALGPPTHSGQHSERDAPLPTSGGPTRLRGALESRPRRRVRSRYFLGI